MAQEEEVVGGVSKAVAILASAALAIFYVAILYAPALILRLPPPTSHKFFMIRRFVCVAISSVVSVIVSACILRVKWNVSELSGVYGVRVDHLWQALVLPLSLTSLLYSGSFLLKLLQLLDSCGDGQNYGKLVSINSILALPTIVINWMFSMATNVSAWRNLIVAPLTEEIVFRACMIPLLFCGGFSTYTTIFFCPVFFSLAHLNHFLEYYAQKNSSLLKAAMIVGTVVVSVKLAPLTEEIVFRACMIPLLFCGGFSTYTTIFFCPVFFSLAHLNHFLEYYAQKNSSLLKAAMIVGFQLGYTVVFGSYASFLFARTGHLIAPLFCHIFCNYMGFPAIYSKRKGIVTLASIAGLVGFMWLLFPLTSPHLYNYRTDGCKCWHRYCIWG